MKLLSGIVALIISISASGQDLVEYNNGTLSRNGEALSQEQLILLSKAYGIGRKTRRWIYRGVLYNTISKPENESQRNLKTATLTASGIIIGGVYFFSGYVIGEFYEDHTNAVTVSLYSLGALSTSLLFYSANEATKPQHWIEMRDHAYEKVARNLNQAIQKESAGKD